MLKRENKHQHGLVTRLLHYVATQLNPEKGKIKYWETLLNNIYDINLKIQMPTIGDKNYISAETLIILAAQMGWFCQTQSPTELNTFEKRNYIIRQARFEDSHFLLELENLCWQESLRTSKEKLVKRLNAYPEGQFVLVYEDKVVGVIYSQRIIDEQKVYKCNSVNISKLHQADGDIAQLLAININPHYQERRWGDQLLEFMLQRCAVVPGINKVIAVTRCRDYAKHKNVVQADYIFHGINNSLPQDPILLFHYLHGAEIVGLVPHYRILDTDNDGNGVLIKYDIHHRVRRDDLNASVTTDGPVSIKVIKMKLEHMINTLLGNPLNQPLSESDTFAELGLDSADYLKLSLHLSELLQQKLSPTFFFAHNTLNKVTSYLTQVTQDNDKQSQGAAQVKNNQMISKNDIAVIAMACRLPGSIKTPNEFWEFLQAGKSAIAKFPKDRVVWPTEINLTENHHGIDHGGFLNAIAEFDADFFKISPQEANMMDPRQRLLLELSWEVLENAGYSAQDLSASKTGVYVGASGSDYRLCLDQVKNLNKDTITTGNSLALLANRLSYFYNWCGPSVVVDTACSSSLVALHQAVQALRANECSQALVAGINLICHASDSINYYHSGLLSKAAQCRPFDDNANGYVRSEGAVVLLLKPLAQAIKSKDIIHAVIKGSASLHHGKSSSLTSPNAEEQATLLKTALQNADVDAGNISYIEAHGTGTLLGDAIELEGIKSANYSGRCMIGSVKSNIGHLEAAAGITSLLKVILCLNHQELTATINFNKLNSHVDLTNSKLAIAKQHQAWEAPSPRRAGISSFGSGGMNAHVILEEYLAPLPLHNSTPSEFLVVLSAKTKKGLLQYAHTLSHYLKTMSNNASPYLLSSIIYSLQCRQAHEERLAFVVSSLSEFIKKLENIVDAQIMMGCFQGVKNHNLSINHTRLFDQPLEKIAQAWVDGADIQDWRDLYTEIPDKIVLPNYPFERSVYWYDRVSEVSPLPLTVTNKSSDSQLIKFLQEIIASKLNVLDSQIDPQTGFFEMGLSSHQIVQLTYEIKQQLDAAFSPQLFFRFKNIATLVEYFESQHLSLKPLVLANNSKQDRYEPFPLSDIQEAFFGGRKINQMEKIGCHIYLEVDLPNIDIYRLNHAWTCLLNYHDMLRAVILPNGQQQVLEILPRYQIKVIDLNRKSDSDQQHYLLKLREEMSHRVYEATQWPLFDIRITKHHNQQTLHFSIDELIADAYSLKLLFSQWDQLYLNPRAVLPSLTVSFRDYVLATKQRETSQQFDTDLNYWLKKLENLPAGPQLPISNYNGNFKRTRLTGVLASAKWQKYKDKLASLHITPTVFIMTLFNQILHQYCQQASFSLILTFFNRLLHPELHQVVGPFISTCLLISQQDTENNLINHMQRNQIELYEDLSHMAVSGVRLLRELKQQRKISSSFALPVVFTSLLGFEEFKHHNTILDKNSYTVTQTPQVYLDHQIYEHQGELRFSWDVAEGYFESNIINTLFEKYCEALTSFDFADNKTRPFALTDQQQAYAFGHSKYGDNVSSRIYHCFDVKHLNVARLEQAWRKVLQHHPMLTTVINNNGAQQALGYIPDYKIIVHDGNVSNNTIEDAILSHHQPLDQWPYFALQVSRSTAQDWRIHFSVDLIIADAPSIALLQQQLFYFYQNLDATLSEPPLTFADYVLAQQNQTESLTYQQSLKYWQNKFADIPSGPELPLLSISKRTKTYRLESMFSGWEKLKTLANQLAVPPSMILLAVYAEILAAQSGSKPFSIVIPGWQRLPIHSEINTIVGDFTSMSWVVVSQQPQTLAEKIHSYYQVVKNDFAHRDVSGLKILRKQVGKNAKQKLSFPVVFTDLHAEDDLQLPKGFTRTKSLSQTTQVYLDNFSYEQQGQLYLCWDIAGNVFPEGLIETLFDRYQQLLNHIITDSEVLNQKYNGENS